MLQGILGSFIVVSCFLARFLLVLFVAGSSAALAKEFKANDRSSDNTCQYVYDWFKRTKDKHAVFVTTGGDSPFVGKGNVGYCQAGSASTLKEATRYAISRCNQEAKKRLKKFKRCKVVESR
jgi:hypothetical protein